MVSSLVLILLQLSLGFLEVKDRNRCLLLIILLWLHL